MNTRKASRRGVAVVVVLVVISITFALSYAIMRSQSTAVLIHKNTNLTTSAREAAMTGLEAALQKISSASWAGVDTTLSGQLGTYAGYQVTFTAGDVRLSTADTDWSNTPYRVTLLSTGHATDPDDTQRVVTHQMRAVVRLIPRDVSDEPSDWSTMQQYTVYQTEQEPFELDLPCQIQGKVRLQGSLRIAKHYPTNDGWWRYLDDLGRMRQAGLGDDRPFTGSVYLPFQEQDGWHLLALIFALDVSTNHVWVDEVGSDWTRPSCLRTYKIYPGGPSYKVRSLGSTLENVTLEPDTTTNPLGVYYREGSLTIRSNVTVRGTLIVKDNIRVDGENVRFEPVDLPGLSGSSDPIRLPVVSCKDFLVGATGSGSLTGLIAVFDDFIIEKGPETTQFSVTGRLITREFYVKEREPWYGLDWDDYYDLFVAQLYTNPHVDYFPLWMQAQGRDPTPRITVKAGTTSTTYHWHNWCDPIFTPHPDDATQLAPNAPGLRWELIEWADNP